MPNQKRLALTERRLNPRFVKPDYEDAGLFKRYPCIIKAGLVPQVSRNRRQDLIVRGFLECGTVIHLVFAGRRAKAAGHLEPQLRKLLSNARRNARLDKDANVDNVRIYGRFHGAWRSRFVRDSAGWETRNWDFMAAQWSTIDGFGIVRQYGEPPYISQTLLANLSNDA